MCTAVSWAQTSTRCAYGAQRQPARPAAAWTRPNLHRSAGALSSQPRGSQAERLASLPACATHTRRSLAWPGRETERRFSPSSDRLPRSRPHSCRRTHPFLPSAVLERRGLSGMNAGLRHAGRRVGWLSAVMWELHGGLGGEKSGNLRMSPLCSCEQRRWAMAADRGRQNSALPSAHTGKYGYKLRFYDLFTH